VEAQQRRHAEGSGVRSLDYIGPVQGKPKNGKKIAAPSRSALLSGELSPAPAGKLLFSEAFEKGSGVFKGGEAVDKGLSFPSKGAEIWNAFSTRVAESTQLRFKLKALADVQDVTVLIWSDKLKDNARYYVTGLKKGEWTTVEFRGVEARSGWAMDGPSLDGSVLNNIKLVFEGPSDARVRIDDFEVRE
jgi:hypothetical protein